ncbi:MAG: hypothetical protein J6Y19_05410, partial [Kiritimatiellae bacterium]|nr:hypothetical protein [Kiritimatiellia bacterium]
MALFHPYRPGEATGDALQSARQGAAGTGSRGFAPAAPPSTVLTHTSRCPSCEITIHTHGTPPP